MCSELKFILTDIEGVIGYIFENGEGKETLVIKENIKTYRNIVVRDINFKEVSSISVNSIIFKAILDKIIGL